MLSLFAIRFQLFFIVFLQNRFTIFIKFSFGLIFLRVIGLRFIGSVRKLMRIVQFWESATAQKIFAFDFRIICFWFFLRTATAQTIFNTWLSWGLDYIMLILVFRIILWINLIFASWKQKTGNAAEISKKYFQNPVSEFDYPYNSKPIFRLVFIYFIISFIKLIIKI